MRRQTSRESTHRECNHQCEENAAENGRGDRIRTRGPRFWRPMLYQLSYTPASARRWPLVCTSALGKPELNEAEAFACAGFLFLPSNAGMARCRGRALARCSANARRQRRQRLLPRIGSVWPQQGSPKGIRTREEIPIYPLGTPCTPSEFTFSSG